MPNAVCTVVRERSWVMNGCSREDRCRVAKWAILRVVIVGGGEVRSGCGALESGDHASASYRVRLTQPISAGSRFTIIRFIARLHSPPCPRY